MNTKHAHLSEAIAAATQAVGGKLSPDKTNQEQKYDYLSADLILSVGGQALAENGVMLLPSVTDEIMTVVDRPNKSPRYDAKVNLAFALTYSDQSLAIPWIGRGSDYSVPDKALYKAITSGHKYFLMKLLNIGAGNEDGEHEAEPEAGKKAKKSPVADQKPPVTREQANGTGAAAQTANPFLWMIDDGLAKHPKQVAAMVKLLDLNDMIDEAEQRDRVNLYRAWRDQGLDTAPAAVFAKAGKLPEADPETA